MGGIGSHLKVSQVDQSVCLGNELNNLSTRKGFLLKNLKSSHPNSDVIRGHHYSCSLHPPLLPGQVDLDQMLRVGGQQHQSGDGRSSCPATSCGCHAPVLDFGSVTTFVLCPPHHCWFGSDALW